MSTDSYRYKAQRYLSRARRMVSSDARWSMIELAAYWRRLAEQAEHQPIASPQTQIQMDKSDASHGVA
jgi:hypothetical protein